MSGQLSLRGIGIPYEHYASIPQAGNRAYARAQLLEDALLNRVSGKEIVGVLYNHQEDIDGILRALANDPRGTEIDLCKQVQDLDLLIDATLRIERLVRNFLSSTIGRIQWDEGIVIFCNTTIHISDQCTTMTVLIERMRTAQLPLCEQIEDRRQVAERWTKQLGPFLCDIFPKEIISIISFYI